MKSNSLPVAPPQRGFTLIELVIIIVILGILAAVAAPRFLDLSREARIATLKGLEGAFRSSVQLVHAKAQIENLANTTDYVDMPFNGSTITVRYGYFAYNRDFSIAIVEAGRVMDVDVTNDWDFTFEPGVTQGAQRSRTSPKGVNDITNPAEITQISRCYVEYILPLSLGDRPTFNIDTDC